MKVIYPGCEIGRNVYIGEFCVIGSASEIRGEWDDLGSVVIGDRTVIRELSAIQGKVSIGADCYVMDKCHIAHDCVLGDGVTLAPGVMMAGHVTIGDHATVGLGAMLHQRVTIGEGAMIGMGSVVTKDVPAWRLWYGNPARDHGWNLVGMRRHGVEVPE
jgi:UDP-N-acetylglucosamine acyltransferase